MSSSSASTDMPAKDSRRFSIAKHVVFSSVVMGALVFGLGGWAALANLAGAVIAPGTFVVEHSVKKVQHSYGGIVSQINVKNGDRVQSGDVLIRLDATQIRSELGVVTSQLVELQARSARLAAERDGLADIVWPKGFMEQNADAKAAGEGEIRLFVENRRAKDSQKNQLRLRADQFREEIKGLTSQRDAKQGELNIIQNELEEVRRLYNKQLTTISRVYTMERESMRLGG